MDTIKFQLSKKETHVIWFAMRHWIDRISNIEPDELDAMKKIGNQFSVLREKKLESADIDVTGNDLVNIYNYLRLFDINVKMASKYGQEADEEIGTTGIFLSAFESYLPLIQDLWKRIGDSGAYKKSLNDNSD